MERFFRRPWIIVACVGAITVFFAAQLPRARLDNNNFRFIPEGDPERIAAEKIDEAFGSQMMILVGLERRRGTILEPEFLDRLRAYVRRVEEIRSVESVQSVVSSDYIRGTEEAIVVEPLVPDGFTGTRAEIAELRDRLTGWELYRRSLVSDDFRSAQVLVYLDIRSEDAGGMEAQEAFRFVRRLAFEAGFPGTEIHLTGIPVFSAVINESMTADLVFLVPLVVAVLLTVLFLSFRRAGGIVLPLLTVVVSAVWAMGAMPILGVELSILSTILPVILVAVGSAYGIHVVSHYYDGMAGARNPDRQEHRKIVFASLRKVWAPIFLAALTTFAGFVSFCFTPVVPIFEFGLFSSFGVLAAFAVSVTLIPALLLLRGPARRLPRFRMTEIETGSEDPLSGAIADALCAVARKRRSVLAAAGIAVVLASIGVSRLVND
ncbi:MAG TPA: MMPL family transporter, partial [Magnetospirillaceae bacterium]|nr:MMPL family transporter [Magnetospirillaceae bacterium]